MFTIVSQTQTGKNPNQMSITEAWKNTLCYIYTMEHYPKMEMNYYTPTMDKTNRNDDQISYIKYI